MPSENSEVLFFRLFVNFQMPVSRKCLHLLTKNLHFPITYQNNLSNKISHKFGLRWNLKPLLAHGLRSSVDWQCSSKSQNIFAARAGNSGLHVEFMEYMLGTALFKYK